MPNCFKIAKKISAIILLFAVLFISINPFDSELYAASSNAQSMCDSVKMGNKIICEFRSSIIGVTKDMQEVFAALWNVFMVVCAYQLCYILVKKEIGEWIKELVEFATKYAMVLMITFPGKVGLDVSIPYKIYLEVEETSMALVMSGSNSFADNSGFDPIMKAYLEVGKIFWTNDTMRKTDLTPTACAENNIASLFTKNRGVPVPLPAQGDCIIELMDRAASTNNKSLLSTLITSFNTTPNGYGGLGKEEATAAINKSEKPSTPDKEKIPAAIKLQYANHIMKIDEIAKYIPVYSEEISLTAFDVGPAIRIYGKKIAIKIATFYGDIFFSAAIVVLWLCILAGLILIGASFFLLTFTPMLVVPMGMIIYQMMWIAGPLEGRSKQLIKTYKDNILPYAIGPALFVFLSYFVVAVLKTLPRAMDAVDSGMPRFAIVLFAAAMVLIISIYGFKILSEVFKWSKDFMSLNLTPLLNHAMKMGDFVGSMVTGALKLGLMAVTGGMAMGMAGGAAVSGIAKAGGAGVGSSLWQKMGGFMNGLGNGLRPGQTGNIGNSSIQLVPIHPLLAGAGGVNTGNGGSSGNVSPSAPSGGGGSDTPPGPPSGNAPSNSFIPPRGAPQQSMEELNERVGKNSTELNDRRSALSDEDLNAQVQAKNVLMRELQAERIKADEIVEKLNKKRKKAEEDEGNSSEVTAILEEIKAQKLISSEKVTKHQEASHEMRGLLGQQSERAALVSSIGNDQARLSSMQALEKNVIKEGVLEAIMHVLPLLGLSLKDGKNKVNGEDDDCCPPVQVTVNCDGEGANAKKEDGQKTVILPGIASEANQALPLTGVPPISLVPPALATPAGGLPPVLPPSPPVTPESLAIEEMKKRQKARKEALELRLAQKKELEDIMAQEADEEAQKQAELDKNPLRIIENAFKDISPSRALGGMFASGAKGIVKDLARSADAMVTAGSAGSRTSGFSDSVNMKHKAYDNEKKKQEERLAEEEKLAKDPELAAIEADIAKMKSDAVREERHERMQLAAIRNGNETNSSGFVPSPSQEKADEEIREREGFFNDAMIGNPDLEQLKILKEVIWLELKKSEEDILMMEKKLKHSKNEHDKRIIFYNSNAGQKKSLADRKWNEKESRELAEGAYMLDELRNSIDVNQAHVMSLQIQYGDVLKAIENKKGMKENKPKNRPPKNPKND